MTIIRIVDKRINNDLWQAGYFGPRLRTWNSLEELDADGEYNGKVHIRWNGDGNGPCVYDVAMTNLRAAWDQLVADGWDPHNLYLTQAAPWDNYLILQGEFYNGVIQEGCWYNLDYTIIKARMRLALQRERKFAHGLVALNLLKGHMTPSSWADFQELLERWPDHVFELSIWSVNIDYARNTVIWEIRQY